LKILSIRKKIPGIFQYGYPNRPIENFTYRILKIFFLRTKHTSTFLMKAFKLASFLLLIGTTFLTAQIRVGEWRDHLPYNQALKIAPSPEKIYCATTGSLFWVNTSDNSINKFSTVNGLHDFEISTICYNPGKEQLLIGYSDGNLDILSNDGVINIIDIKDKQNLNNKKIKDIFIDGDKAYLCCGFGIVVLNLARMEISDTYYIGENGSQIEINGMCTDEVYIYAATSNGLLRAEKNNPNLVNYSYWKQDPGIPYGDGPFSAVTNFGGKIVAISVGDQSNPDRIYLKENDAWTEFNASYPSGTKFQTLRNQGDQLILVSTYNTDVFSSTLQLTRRQNCVYPRDAWLDSENQLWVADRFFGLSKFSESGNETKIIPNGPYSNHSFRLSSFSTGMLVSGGGYDGSYTGVYNNGEISMFSNNQWSSWVSDSLRDVITLISNPANPSQFFAATWGYGVYEFTNGKKTKVYNASNSSIQSIYPGQDYCRIYGMAFDSDHNFWVSNSGVSNCISVRLKNGNWKSLPYNNLMNNPPIVGDILVTSNNTKWVLLPKGYGLFAFNEKGTFDNTEDDDYSLFQPVDDNGNTISSNLFDMAEDLDGNIWVGTASGPVVFYNPSAVFEEGGISANQILIPRNDGTNNADILLSTETVTSIAIDGGNRKWFGTQNSGAYLMSPDGIKQIHHFTVENSPLLSNTINDIAIDGKTGEVFFATPRGLVSYRDAATQASETFGKVYVFPNPVREDYTGDIIITGMAANVKVKITDISGNLVYEMDALGGQAVWNGKNFDGRRVATGVYLVFCSNDDGSQTTITKLLFIH
jgi:sugar lactone lactonase YvrE